MSPGFGKSVQLSDEYGVYSFTSNHPNGALPKWLVNSIGPEFTGTST